MTSEQTADKRSSGKKPFMIGVSGGTASGKSTVSQEIKKRVEAHKSDSVAIVTQDSFYRVLSQEEKNEACAGRFNFDHPNAMNVHLMLDVLKDLKEAKRVSVPKYDFRTHSNSEDLIIIEPLDVIIVEGILIFYDQEIRELFDMKLFVDTDPDTRLARRVQRDLSERGRNLTQILHQYLNLVKPAYEEFCFPTKKYADVIIPRGAENKVAIDLIVQHILEILRNGSSRRQRSNVRRSPEMSSLDLNGVDTMPSSASGSSSGRPTRTDVIRPH